MKSKTGHISEGLNKSALHTLVIFCSSHSLFKGDKELSDSFDNFLAGDYTILENAAREELLSDFEAIQEILPVLYELGDQLADGNSPYEAVVFEQADPGNRLYASLKRHPE